MTKQEDLIFNKFARIIDEGDVGFFFGAGMSRNAGVPVVSTIVSKIVSSLDLPCNFAKKLIELKYPFEAFLEILSRYASLEKLLGVFNQGDPTEFHLLTKFLVEKGLVTQLMTTNFDLLIEKTGLSSLNVVYEEKCFCKLSADKVNYIKVHGGINKIETIRTVMSSIAKRQMRSKRKFAVDFFFNKAGLKTIFVFGYSCSDQLDLTPSIKSVTGGNTRIIFVNYTQSSEVKETRLDANNPFSVFENICIECNTDSFIRYLADYFNVPSSSDPTHFSIDEYVDYSWLGIYDRYFCGAGLLFRNSCYEEAADLLRQALNHNGDAVRRAEMISFLFEIYYNIQTITEKDMNEILPSSVTFKTMEKEKDEALRVLDGISDETERLRRIAGLKTGWGHFLLGCRKYDEAMLSYRDALEVLMQTSNAFRIHQGKNNIANAIFTRWKNGESELNGEEVYRECYKIWVNCYNYFRQSPYPFEHEISCENMAELLLRFRKKQTKRIERYLNSARELSMYLNDQTGIDICEEMMRQLYAVKYEID